MARKIHTRYQITGNLIAQSPIHVGGIGGNVDTDLALAINGEGKYYIPGTSLAGALRALMTLIEPEKTNYLWGGEQQKIETHHASFIVVEDADIFLGEMVSEIREGVAIDRNWGTAVEKMKYNRAILPRGVKISLKLTLERAAKLSDDSEWQEYQNLFSQLLTALSQGQISLGAAKTRGLGRVKLYDLQIYEQKLGQKEGVIDTLINGGTKINHDSFLIHPQPLSTSSLNIVIDWKPISPVMVKAEAEGIAVDILPLVSAVDGGVTFVIPGSSLKGSLRSQAERIVRTVRHQDTPQEADKQLEVELVKTLFGTPSQLISSGELGYLGTLYIDDCFAKIPLTYNQWTDIETSTNSTELRQALNRGRLENTQQSFHVAIDRWTGGAADSFLYSILEPRGFSWQPINLNLDLTRLVKNSEELEYFASITLLLLTFRDLIEGRIPLGFGTNRGLGTIHIEKISFKGTQELEELTDLSNLTLTSANFQNHLSENFLNQLNSHWKTWINQSN